MIFFMLDAAKVQTTKTSAAQPKHRLQGPTGPSRHPAWRWVEKFVREGVPLRLFVVAPPLFSPLTLRFAGYLFAKYSKQKKVALGPFHIFHYSDLEFSFWQQARPPPATYQLAPFILYYSWELREKCLAVCRAVGLAVVYFASLRLTTLRALCMLAVVRAVHAWRVVGSPVG